MKKEKKLKKKKFRKILTCILFACVFLLFSMIFYLNIFSTFYIVIALIIFLILVFGICFLNFSKAKGWRLIGYFLSAIVISGTTFILIYLINTLGFLFSFTGINYNLKTYNVLVLDESQYENIEKLTSETIGISETIENNDLKKLKDKIEKEVIINYSKYEDMNSLVGALSENEVEAIILENSELEILKENDVDTYNSLRIIYKVTIKNTINELSKIININKESFNIYISGIDTYGSISSASRSDVNIVVSINPSAEKILITWIPRDYYVRINSTSYKDKLTHAGIYGIDTSIYAIEDLLDIEINYYVKVNFTSFMEIIDVLNGVEVYNDETFTSIDGITYEEGYITLDSKSALSFVRERKNLTSGDIGRGKNQIKVLEALINKVLTPSTIKKYNNILNSLKGSFVTNMSDTTMLSFIKKEINSRRNWIIETNVLTGIDSYEYTYTYKNTKLYVMLPDDDVVNEASSLIREVMNN